MANYVTPTSDKTKHTARLLALLGGLGLHYFYVGRIIHGLIRLVFGLLFWGLIVEGYKSHETPMLAAGIGYLVVLVLYDIIRISLGKFKDNTGAYLRQ